MAAGKISGPGGTPPSDVPPAQETQETRPKGSAAFADKLRSAGAPVPPTGTRGTEETAGITADLAAQLGAGKITPEAAVDRVIDRVVDKQVGVDAPAAVRDRVRAALESAVADDPILSEKIKTLGR